MSSNLEPFSLWRIARDGKTWLALYPFEATDFSVREHEGEIFHAERVMAYGSGAIFERSKSGSHVTRRAKQAELALIELVEQLTSKP